MAKQEKALTEKLKRLGYADFETKPGEEDVPMLYIEGRHICGVAYAMEMPEDALKALIDETVATPGD